MTAEENALLDKALSVLTEHYDAIQICCSRVRPGGETEIHVKGEGNWFARYGMLQHWLIKGEEETRVDSRPDNPDDGWRGA